MMYHDVSICDPIERECAELPMAAVDCGMHGTRRVNTVAAGPAHRGTERLATITSFALRARHGRS
jgi:hypothetical protein